MTIETRTPEATTDGRTTDILELALVELIDLSIQGKQAHWVVTGPMFKPVPEHLDAIVDEIRTAYDDVAERMSALEVAPDGRLATVAGTSPVNPMPAGWQRDAEVVARMLRRLEGLSSRLGGWIDELAELDPVTQDLLIGIRRGIDKHAWMLRVQTRPI
jgi:starvation-inducible DNA-binding protein